MLSVLHQFVLNLSQWFCSDTTSVSSSSSYCSSHVGGAFYLIWLVLEGIAV